MKIISKYFMFCLLSLAMCITFTACSDDDGPVDPYDINYVYLYAPTINNHVIKYMEDGTFITSVDEVESLVPVKSTKPAPSDMAVTIEIDNSLIDEYNKTHGTDYKPLKSAKLVSDKVTIKQGKYLSGDSIKLKYTDMNEFLGTEPQKFVVPVIIKTAPGATVSEKHVFYMTYETKILVFGLEDSPIGTLLSDRSKWKVMLNGTNDITSAETDGSTWTDQYMSAGSVIDVDFGETLKVNTIDITFYSYYYAPYTMTFEVSEDGTNYTELGDVATREIAHPHIAIYNPRSFRYLRMTTGGRSAYMAEINMYTAQ